MAQGLERIPLAVDSDFKSQPVRANFPDAPAQDFKLVSFEPDQAQTQPAPASMGVGDTLSSLGRNVWDAVVYHTPAAVAAAVEGDDPYATWDWKDALIGRARQRAQEVSKPGDADTKTAIPGITAQDINSLGPSAGFSVAGAAAGLGAGIPAGMVASPVAGYAAGMAASGTTAYRMATNQFVRDLHDTVNAESLKTTGKPVSPQEFQAKQAQLADTIKAYGLWEAVPEAAGNALSFGILTAPVKGAIGKLFGKNIATRFAGKLGALYGEELATETVTQMGQHNAEVDAGMTKAPKREFTSPQDWHESLKEVAGPTMLQTTLMAGGFKAGQMAKDRLMGKADQPDNAIPADDIGAGPGGSGVDGEFIPATPAPALANQPGGTTYDQSRTELPPGQTMLPRLALPAPEDGGPSDRQVSTAIGLLKHSPKASPDLLQRLMRVDQTMATMLFNHWKANGQVTGNQATEIPAPGDQGQGADIAGSRVVGGFSNGAVSFAPGAAAKGTALGGEPGMAMGGAGPDAVTPLDVQAHAAATSPFNNTPQPTEAQKAAGNYKVGRIKFQGMDISIENPAGSVRSGTNADGKAWENTLQHHYGYIRGTTAKDGDHVDAFIKPGAQTARTAYVIDQIDPKTGKYDEAKVILGADSEADAQAIYHANYEQGWQGMGAITAMPIEQFKDWIKSGKTKKPVAYTEPKEIRTASRAPKTASSLLQAIVNRGGISREIMSDVGADPAGRYMPGLFTKTGTTDLSALAGYLFDEDGFHQIHQDSPIGPARELEDLIVRAINGERILSTTAMEKGMQAEETAKLKEKAQRLGVKTVARKLEDIAAEVAQIEERNILDEETRLEDEALVAYNEAVDALNAAIGEDATESFLEDLASRYQDETHLNYLRSATIALQEKLNAQVQSAGKPDETAAGQAGPGDEAGRAQGGTDSIREEARPTLSLSGQSEAEIRAEQERVAAAEAQRKAEDERAAAAERQARIDAEVAGRQDVAADNFTLTPQVNNKTQQKKADQAEIDRQLAGQGDIFGAPANSEKQPAAPVAESNASPMERDDAGVAPGQDGAAAERKTDAKGNPIYKMGDRVEYVSGGYAGRHGAISQVTPMTTTVLGLARDSGYYAQSQSTSYYYHVKTDNGADFMASPEEIRFETDKPDSVVPDITVDGMVMEPRRVFDGIGYAKRSAEGSRAAAQRARKASAIADHKRAAERNDAKAEQYQAAWDAWAAKHPDEAEKVAPAAKPDATPTQSSATGTAGDPAAVIKAAGLVVTKGTTNNGKPVWNVSGNTKTHMDIIKRAGGRWYGPKKVWSFYNDDPSAAIAAKLPPPGPTIAGTPTIAMSDKGLQQIAASNQPAAEKAKAELEARDKADEVDLGALFDEVLAEETGGSMGTIQGGKLLGGAEKSESWWKGLTPNGRRRALNAVGVTAIKPEVLWGYLPAKVQKDLTAIIGTEKDPVVADGKVSAGEAAAAPKSKKPKADTLAEVREFYKPGNIIHVDYWNQHDKVLEFKEGDLPGQWNVKVIQVVKNSDGQWVPKDERMEPARWHATSPGKDRVVDSVAPQRTAGQAAVSAATNTAKGLQDAIAGLGKLFGSNGSRLSMGISFDEDTYAKAKPLFAQAVAHFQDAGADIKEAMRAVVRMVLDKFGPQVAENMKDYIVRFMEDVKAGNVVYDDKQEADENGNDGTRPAAAGTRSGGQRDGDAGAAADGRPGGRAEAGDRAGDLGNGDRRPGGGKPLDALAEEAAGTGTGGRTSGGDQGRGGSVATGPGTRGSEPLAGRDRDKADVRDRPERPAAGSVAGNKPSKAPSTEGVSVSGKADFQISEDDALGEGGQKTKARNNIAAIRLLKKLAADDRRATPAEQKVLAKYVGWGGIKQIFDDAKADWTKDRNDLKALLTPEEYAAARRSMLDAHYTSMDVVSGMWSAAAHLGFKGGRVLEPSVGVGNFFGLMPADVRARSSLYGVELDNITAQLAQNLYPSATVANMGFQDVELPSNSFDLVVGNPPFGKQALYDKNHPELRSFSIHNFFFAKAIDKVRPGGILQMVVSHHLMDAVDSTARDYITARADLIGAIRLPDSAFRSNAGTDVVTDIIFLKKREPGAAPAGFDWSDTKAITLTHPKTGERFDFRINGYYDAHPEMIVGDQVPTGKMNNAPNAYNVAARAGESLYEGLGRAVSTLPRDVMTDSTKPLVEIATAESEVPEGTKVLGYYMAGSVVMQRQPDAMGKRQGRPVEFKDAKSPRRAEAMIKVRNALRDLMRAERADETDAVLATKRTRLNTLYDAFKKEYGYINQQTNRRAFRDDPDLPLLESLEPKFDPGLGADAAKKRGEQARKPAAEKADIFTMRVLPAIKEVTTAATAQDALIVSLNMKGEVDPDYMAELYGKPWEQIRTELGALVFHNPNGGWEAADGYLSGNVKAKLKIAEAAAEADPQYQPNVEALRAVIPADVPALKISVRLGSPWIPSDVMEKLAAELWGDTGASIKFVKQVARWAVRSEGGDQTARNSTWGVTYGKLTGGNGVFTAPMIFEHVANNKAIVIKENVGDSENPVWKTNEPATEAIRAKAQEMAAKFKEWIWQDQDRRDRLAAIYNENYNTDRRRSYDGSHLTLPGSSSLIKLRRHQLNAVWRAIQDRVILLDHVVGAGKTYEMAAIAMELRRLGFSRKPMFVVPNSLVRQWRDEFYKLYPDANVLAATESDFEKKNRKRFMAKIATGDWDAVIVAHSSFKKVGMPYETEKAILDEQLKEISDAIEDMKRERGDKNVVRDMERIKIKLEERMKSLKNSGGKKDDAVSFDELGVDGLFVDEAHLFKNLFYYSQMRNVTGLGNPNGSGRAFDLFVKTRYLDQQYSGKALIGFATGTPVSNSLVEMFTMQRYLAWNKLKESGLHLLDAWAGVYGDVQQVYEVHPSGTGYRLSTRFAKFVNLPSLMELYRGFADVITMDDLKQQAKDAGGVFPVPKIKGLRPRNIVAERSDEQRMFFGVPEFGRDGKGGIAFKHEADLKVRKSDKDGKWYPWKPGGDKVGTEGFDTEEQATAERDTLIKLPVVGWNSGSILWKFENLKELTKNSKGKINALSITNEARKAGLDYRLINPMAPDFPGSKINLAVKEAVRIYHAWSADKGAQLMFCDLSVPKTARAAAASKERDAYVRGSDGGIQAVKATVVTIEGVEASFLAVKRGGKGAEGGFVLYDGLTGAHTGITEHQKKDAVDALKARIEADGLGWLEDLQDRYGEITDADIADYKDAQGKEDDAADDEGDDGAISVSELMALAGGNTFSVYDDIKTKLVAAGIPENEIAFIHDFDTAIKKNGLFKKVKAGEIRILLGSTEKMGAGMNVQERLVALHHLDAPWRPSDLEQREGRIIRQGNKLYERDPDGFEVEVMRYGTRQTYDTRMWQIIEHKAAGVEQLRKAGDDLLEIDDVGGEAANAADMKAAASGNPLILDEIKLRNEAKSLEAQQFAYIQSKASMQDKVRWYRGAPGRAEDQIAEIQPFVDAAEKNPADPFSYTTPDGKVLTDKKDVALPLTTAFADAAQSKLGDTIDAGQYRGLLLRFRKGMGGIVAYLGSGAKPMPAADYGIEDKFSPSGIFTRLDNALERVKKTIADHRRMADQSVSQIPKLEAEIAKPFAKEDALKAARARHREVVSKLQKAGGGIELSPGMRAELDQAIAERTGKKGMESRSRGQGSASTESTRAIQSIVDKFLKQFAGAAALDIRVARTVADIPERFRPSPFAEGVFNDDAGLIYLVAMNLKHANGQVNAGRVWQVLMHEAVGHFGLAQMMGGRFGGILKEVMRAAKAKGGVGEDIYEPGHPDYATIEAVKLRYPGASDKELAQEVLARMAETDPGRTLFGYVRAVVRQWLRDMARAAGITLDVTTAELNDLVAQASRYMRRGDGVAQGVDVDALGVADMAVGGMASKATGMESRRAPTAGQPQQPRTGMLDTILRKAGGELAAKITGPAYDKLTAYLGGKVPEGVKAGMVSDYGLDESYVDRRTGMQTEQQKAARQTKTFVEGLMGLDRAQSRVAYQWLNNRGAEADRLMAKLPPESQQVLKDIKIQIAKLTIEAVRLGQLDAETAERNFLAYLHRSYAKYDLNTDDKTWKAERAKAIKILGDQYKGRGLKMDVDPDRIHSAPGWWKDEMKGKRVKVLKNEAGRFAFVAEGTAIPPNLSGYKVEGVWEIRARKAADRITLWRDFTQDERTMMGELDEAKYAVARTLLMMNRDIEVGRFHEWVADEYAKTPEEAEEEGLQMADASDSMMRAFTPDEWVTVPTSKIPGTGVFKYGALAGMVVPGPVWNDIRQISAGRFEPFGAAYASILRAWKLSKTALTPTTHVNNIMGNFVMADMHDVGARDAIAAVRLMVAAANGDKDAKAMLDRFEDSGATQGMFTTHELKKEVLEPLLQQLREEVGMADDEAAILKVSAIMSLALHGKFGEAWAGAKAAAKQSTAGRATGAVVTKAQDYYQAEDSVFRLAAFLKSIDEGKTDQEAGKLARKAFLDYHINAPWINAMRGTAMPFIAFAYRAIPMLTETAAKKPWKIAKYMLVAGGLNALAYAMLGADADEDKERAFLPDEKAGRLWGIVPKLIRMPWNRESKLRDGRTSSDPVFLDVRRWIPVGDVVDYGQDKTALPMIPQPMMPGGPLILAAEFLVNKSAFTGRELTKETDTWVEKAAKVVGHFYKGFAPNVPIPYSGTWAGTKIDNAIKGKEDPLGRAYPVPEAIASGFGLKLERYPVDTLQRNSVLDMKGKLKELDDEKRQAARDYGRQGMTKRELDEKVAEIVGKKNAAVEEYRVKERRAMGKTAP